MRSSAIIFSDKPEALPLLLSSYATEPKYQKYFTIGWTSALGAFLLFKLAGLFIRRRSKIWSFISSVGLWSLPGLSLTVGQRALLAYFFPIPTAH